MDGPANGDVCSICQANFHIPCQANCSHWFCGSCILQVWDHGAALHTCKCLLCRREITLLVPSEASLRQHGMAMLLRYCRGLKDITVCTRMQDHPFLLRRLAREIMDPHRSLPFFIKTRVYLAIIVSAIYVISPVDIIPEGVVGIIGLLDDMIIIFICFLHVAALYRNVLISRHGGA